MVLASRVVYKLASLALLLTTAAGGITSLFRYPSKCAVNQCLADRANYRLQQRGLCRTRWSWRLTPARESTYETITNATGSYYVTDLPPGTYRIEVEKVGFKAVIKSDLVLHVQDALEN